MDSSEEGFLLFKPGRHKPLQQYRHMLLFSLQFSLAAEYRPSSLKRNASLAQLRLNTVYLFGLLPHTHAYF